jgi:signal transduction histidine kinase
MRTTRTPTADEATRIRWLGLGLLGYGLLFTLYTVLQPFGEAARLIVSDLVYIPSSLAAGLLAFLVVRAAPDRRLRWAWALIGLGFLSWAVADSLWAWWELALGFPPASPHVTDIFYLALYPLFFLALLIYPTPREDGLRRARLLLDVLAVATALSVFGWYYLIAPILATEAEEVPALLVNLAYPLGDLLLIWALVRLYYVVPGRAMSRALLMLVTSMGLNVIADAWYVLLTQRDLYYSGHFVDALWVLGSLAAGGGALAQYRALRFPEPQAGPSPSPASPLRSPSRQLLPYLMLVPLSALMVGDISYLSLAPREVGLLLGGATTILLVIARQVLTIQENNRLNEELAARMREAASLNERLQQANAALQEADRLKSEFISNVSHELRTPLTNILGYTELLLDSPSGDTLTSFQAEGLRTVHNNARRLLNLVNDLLDASRLEAGRFAINPAPLAPAPLLRQLVAEVRLMAEKKGLTLEAYLPDDLPPITADGPRLAQVMNNLLTNAIKFTPAGGQIRVEASATKGGREPVPPEGEWLVIRVADTGIGIAPEDLPHIFSRFHRAAEAQRRAIPGTGLGLYVAKAIVEAHGGRIGVESQPGRGSRFWFYLPVQADPGPRQSHRRADGQPRSAPGKENSFATSL